MIKMLPTLLYRFSAGPVGNGRVKEPLHPIYNSALAKVNPVYLVKLQAVQCHSAMQIIPGLPYSESRFSA